MGNLYWKCYRIIHCVSVLIEHQYLPIYVLFSIITVWIAKLCVCPCVCVYVSVCVSVCTCVFVCLCACYTFMCTCSCDICVCSYMCACMRMCVHMSCNTTQPPLLRTHTCSTNHRTMITYIYLLCERIPYCTNTSIWRVWLTYWPAFIWVPFSPTTVIIHIKMNTIAANETL